jgi:hypothetical protein
VLSEASGLPSTSANNPCKVAQSGQSKIGILRRGKHKFQATTITINQVLQLHCSCVFQNKTNRNRRPWSLKTKTEAAMRKKKHKHTHINSHKPRMVKKLDQEKSFVLHWNWRKKRKSYQSDSNLAKWMRIWRFCEFNTTPNRTMMTHKRARSQTETPHSKFQFPPVKCAWKHKTATL